MVEFSGGGRQVLVVEVDSATEQSITPVLRDWGYEPVVAKSLEEALALLDEGPFVFTLLGLNLDGADGLDFLRHVRTRGGDPGPGPVVLIGDEHDLKRVAEGTSLGADDFLQTPFEPGDLENVVKEVLFRPRRPWSRGADGDDPAARLQQEVGLWRSAKMRELWQTILQAARVDVTVLICGETGTGKDVVARAIHHFSSRRGHPFVRVNCAAMPRELLESELFGHERGAFTGAHQLKIGKFEAANRGTIFLDEIGDLHPALQAKLLHVLQDGAFSRVGGKSAVKVDVRVLAATNRDLERAVIQERFREDLYYRLDVIQIVVPPLRGRMEEVPLLAQYFAQRYARLFNRDGFTLSPEAIQRLMRHHYPGNVRELENIVKRMIVLDDPHLARTQFTAGVNGGTGGESSRPTPAPEVLVAVQALSLKEIACTAARSAERAAIAKALDQTGWNRVRAAKLLRISYRALLYKIKNFGLDPEPLGLRSRPMLEPEGNASPPPRA